MDVKEITMILPWPPSVNSIWATDRKGNWYSTKVATDFKELVKYAVYKAKSPKFNDSATISVEVIAYPPDNRKRDLDNIFKILADALQEAKVYKNDVQIKRIYMEMQEKDPNGKGYVGVSIEEIV